MATPPNDTTAPSKHFPQHVGDYTLLAKIGSGGMASVYRAKHTATGQAVALKVLALHLQDRADVRARFQREAYMLQQFDHPHILPVTDYGADGEILYLVMPLLDGRSLEHILQGGVALPRAAVGRFTREIASALDYAHARGVIHRDIKPANILLDPGASVLLADFGVAHPAVESARMTTPGSFIGTAAYASPEQCRGDPLDRRSDIYALAVLTFQMATGRLPFEGSTALAVIKQQLSESPPNPLAYNPALPLALYGVLARGMAKAPDDRYSSALAFSEAVDRALGLHALPDVDSGRDDDDWLSGDISPLTFDQADTVDAADPTEYPPHATKPRPPAAWMVAGRQAADADSAQTISFDDLPPAGTEDDPFAGVQVYEYDVADLIFDDTADLEPPDDDVSFVTAFGPVGVLDPDDVEPVVIPRPQPGGVRIVNGVIRPLVPPPTVERRVQPTPPPQAQSNLTLYVSVLASVLLLAVVAAGTMIAWRLRDDDESTPLATYHDPTLGITFDYPQNWTLQRGQATVFSDAETATVALANVPVPVEGPYPGAAIVITLQQIDPVMVFGVPPVCQGVLADGPGVTFACMRARGFATPVFEAFHSPHAWGVRLPGTLPPVPASIPAVLLPTDGPPWIAVAIAHWDAFPDARVALLGVASSVRQ